MIWYIILLVLLLCLLWWVLYVVIVFAVDEWKMKKTAPYVGSYGSHKKILLENHTLLKPYLTEKKLLDMWCGDGGMLRFFTCHRWVKKAVGYDIRRFPVWFGKVLNKIWWYKNIQIHNADFSYANPEKYDVIYLFLWKSVVENLESWLQERIWKDTIIITNTFHFSHWKPFDTLKNKKGKIVFQMYRK